MRKLDELNAKSMSKGKLKTKPKEDDIPILRMLFVIETTKKCRKFNLLWKQRFNETYNHKISGTRNS